MMNEDRLIDAGFPASSPDDPYQAATVSWLKGKSENTQRSYETALRAFFEFTGLHPSQVTADAVAHWKDELRREELADSTVAQRLSALSSYYWHLVRQGIHDRNPVDNVDRSDLDVNPYQSPHHLHVDAFRRILEVIPSDTEIGARDSAVLLFYVLCARRRSEVVSLSAEDLEVDRNKVTYRIRLENGEAKEKELPLPVWQAIQHYLKVSGRKPTGDQPIFTATTDAGQYLRDYYGTPDPKSESPLSGEAVAQALKKYAAKAGIDPATVSLRDLRHLGAKLYYDASGDLEETRQFLDHERLDTTRLRIKGLTSEEHRYWKEMADALGVNDDQGD